MAEYLTKASRCENINNSCVSAMLLIDVYLIARYRRDLRSIVDTRNNVHG